MVGLNMVLEIKTPVFFKVCGEYQYGQIEKFQGKNAAIVLADNHMRYLLPISDIYRIKE